MKERDSSLNLQSARTTRRSLLKGMGLLAAAGTGVLAAPHVVRAQGKTLAFWTTQRGPTQMKAYEEIWKAFEAANPGFTVAPQYLTEEEYLPKLTAAMAANQVPDLMSHMPPEFAMALNDRDLLSPMDEILKEVGADDFFENSLELLKDEKKGFYPALAIVNSTTTGPLWYRKDLLEKAGVTVPTNWAEYLAVAKATTKGGIFGNVYPFGKTSMGDKLFLQTIWQAGGTVFNPDLSVAFNSPQVVRALEFVQAAVKLSPPSAATYAYAETINVFVQGRVAMAPYSGRVLGNMVSNNAKLENDFSVTPFPHLAEGEGGRKVFVGDFQSLVIPAAAKDKEVSKAMALWLFRKENYIKYLHAVPGHNLPNLKSIANSEEYKADPLLQKYAQESQTLIDATSMSRSFLKETPEHQLNVRAGSIFNSRVLVETIHDVIIGGVSPADAAAKGADKIASIMKA
ncbi:sugar ABC transporter substrate-binding protein [Agaricicola taiwanensis]|uniref:Sugar ABC transporter substrate-binding protein n=1 Tax=Agaricicola taiwanensis TaxID=591372 RepID=A0A8J2YFA1_9RHOB|nr:sugar ABC transporter substrate-binding protein [Agaricicola taiwanensis]GGE41167.1 sugar ABC transporter substrate-binding protein [Agaricicola taiwanensis]